jgi:hypothetical protein
MQVLTIGNIMYIIICDICRVVEGNMANGPRTSLFALIEGNGFLKLKGFLKHEHFAYKLAQFTFLIKKQHFGIQRFKTIKGKKKPKQVNHILLCLDKCVQFYKLEACNDTSLHPFISSFP